MIYINLGILSKDCGGGVPLVRACMCRSDVVVISEPPLLGVASSLALNEGRITELLQSDRRVIAESSSTWSIGGERSEFVSQ